jgi:hypothetical protein
MDEFRGRAKTNEELLQILSAIPKTARLSSTVIDCSYPWIEVFWNEDCNTITLM